MEHREFTKHEFVSPSLILTYEDGDEYAILRVGKEQAQLTPEELLDLRSAAGVVHNMITNRP